MLIKSNFLSVKSLIAQADARPKNGCKVSAFLLIDKIFRRLFR